MADIATEYTRLRKKHPTLPSRNALAWARANVKPLALDWSGKPGHHVNAATTTRDGFDIRIVVDYDDRSDPRAEYTRQDTGIRNPDFRAHGDYEMTYLYRNDPQKGCRYIKLESDYTVRQLADDYHKQGMSRAVAWQEAERSLSEEAREAMSDDVVTYVITAQASVNGIQLGDASIGGFDVLPDWAVPRSEEREIETAVEDYDLIGDAVEEAREALSRLRTANIA